MKIVRYRIGDRTEYGIQEGGAIEALAMSPFRGMRPTGRRVEMNAVKLLVPCLPSKVVAIGANYRSHCMEVGQPIPDEPMVFFKPSTSVVGPDAVLVRPEGVERFDYEAEVGIVIGRRAFKVSREEALDYVLGYTCTNDVSVRDWQNIVPGWQWARAKGSDTFSPIGPCIETEADPYNLPVESRLNGETRQKSSTSDLVFPIPELIRYVTETITLLPGDVIMTGTPSGVGGMQPGDVIEIIVEGVGTLRNHVA